MAPKQARGAAVDKRCNIWLSGVALFEILTGKRWFTGAMVSDMLAEVMSVGRPLTERRYQSLG
jgi:serine/threonine protein kinase